MNDTTKGLLIAAAVQDILALDGVAEASSPGLIDEIKQREGYRESAYLDSEGAWTVGYGTNLQTLKVPHWIAEYMLYEALANAEREASKYAWFAGLNPVRKDVVVEMIYNLGPTGFRNFRKTRAAIAEGRWNDAGDEMLDSLWARQLKHRSALLARRMKTGAL